MVRSTRVNRRVTTTLQTAERPLTLREIWARVQRELPDVAFSTIYRIISQLVADHRVRSIDWRERAGRYEWAADHHHHIRCLICGDVTEIREDVMRLDLAAIAARTGYTIQDHMIEFEGLCATCRPTQKGAE